MGDLLDRLASLAAEVGDRTVENDARDLSRRLDAGRLFLASVGQFKRGKSTLLNALVGESVLPTGVLPVTSVVTLLRHGTRATASVTYEHGTVEAIPPAAVADYVTEVSNARVWGGIHYRTSTRVGEAMGRRIGALTLQRALTPLESSGSAARSATSSPVRRSRERESGRSAPGAAALRDPTPSASKPSASEEP